MIPIDLPYLRRIATRESPASILSEPKFLDAQKLFFEVVQDLKGTVDFEIADMREVHAIAALEDVKNKRVLDVGCGSTEPYVLENTFRNRYPPFFAEMLTRHGAHVTGVDIRENPTATYDHRQLDLTKKNWMKALDPPYDIIACLSLFNAPGSPFENNPTLCDRIMRDMHALLSPDGVLIVTLRDDCENPKTYLESMKFTLLHLDGNCALASPH
ncbi:methyltransferase domain-containing protein [Candidatus Peribacteria bacterium]|nr:methyltransferase domain-containing protein [Candidatus Peribacteria bacterium]